MRGSFTDPREAAWRALCDYDTRHPPWEGLRRRCLKGLEGADRGLAAEILGGCLRHRRLLDATLEQATGRERKRSKPDVWCLLRIGAYQIQYLERVPDHAAVNETVELAKRHVPRAMGFVNAALRGLLRLREAGDPTVDLPFAVRHSLPDPLVETLRELLPESEMDAAAVALNDPGDLGVRANPLVPASSGGEPVDFTPHPLIPGCLTLPRGDLKRITSALERGEVAVQDAASQLVAHLIAPRPGQRIVDLCAAPGGKSAHLAALTGGDLSLVAADPDKERRAEMAENFKRLGVTCAEVADMGLAEMLLAAPEPDVILVDAPCSGWGTVRHKPDLKWRRRDLAALAKTQREILDRAAPHLGPGGVLVYSVCTFLPGETSQVIADFLRDHPAFSIQDPREFFPEPLHALVEPDGTLRTWPHRHACDGFFAVRLVKS